MGVACPGFEALLRYEGFDGDSSRDFWSNLSLGGATTTPAKISCCWCWRCASEAGPPQRPLPDTSAPVQCPPELGPRGSVIIRTFVRLEKLGVVLAARR